MIFQSITWGFPTVPFYAECDLYSFQQGAETEPLLGYVIHHTDHFLALVYSSVLSSCSWKQEPFSFIYRVPKLTKCSKKVIQPEVKQTIAQHISKYANKYNTGR